MAAIILNVDANDQDGYDDSATNTGFWIYYNEQWQDISHLVDLNSFELQDRTDDTFSSGKFDVWTTSYRYSIPPYTVLKIDGTYYVCKSTANLNLAKKINNSNLYVHNFEFLEATAILANFIVGTKILSNNGTNTTAMGKINVLLELMESKYHDYSFVFSGTYTPTNTFEYEFGAGYTLYDCLSEIADKDNCRVYVYRINVSAKKIYLRFNQLSLGRFDRSNYRFLSVSFSQNSDEYGEVLETEATNVVDRDTTTHFRYISCRSKNDTLLTTDAAIIKLPTRVESISDWGIEIDNTHVTTGIANGQTHPCSIELKASLYSSLVVDYYGAVKSWSEWRTIILAYGEDIDDIYNASFGIWVTDKDDWDGTQWVFSTNENKLILSTDGAVTFLNESKFSMRTKILEKAKWDLLTEQDKTNIAVYESGGDTIDNLYAWYKWGDLWSHITGFSRTPLLYDSTTFGSELTLDGSDLGLELFGSIMCNFQLGGYSGGIDPKTLRFYVDAKVMTDPFLFDKKTNTPINEMSWRGFARSYNGNAKYIDFDKITNGMAVLNNCLGTEEMSMELDSTGLATPKPRYYVEYRTNQLNVTVKWYILSVITTYRNGRKISMLNCCYDYNKKADAIGVETQFKSTKLETQQIVTRPIYIRQEVQVIAIEDRYTYFMGLTFTFADGTTKEILSPCALMKSDSKVIFYCEADDFYCFGKKQDPNDSTFLTDVSYVDENNEAVSVTAKLYQLYGNISLADSLNLPDIPSDQNLMTLRYTSSDIKIYKDGRERLTFTLELAKK